jgi:hypothetical protein
MVSNISKSDLLIIITLFLSITTMSLLIYEFINNENFNINIIILFIMGIAVLILFLIYRKHLKGFI